MTKDLPGLTTLGVIIGLLISIIIIFILNN